MVFGGEGGGWGGARAGEWRDGYCVCFSGSVVLAEVLEGFEPGIGMGVNAAGDLGIFLGAEDLVGPNFISDILVANCEYSRLGAPYVIVLKCRKDLFVGGIPQMPAVIGFGVAHVGVEYLFRLFFVLPLAHFSPCNYYINLYAHL